MKWFNLPRSFNAVSILLLRYAMECWGASQGSNEFPHPSFEIRTQSQRAHIGGSSFSPSPSLSPHKSLSEFSACLATPSSVSRILRGGVGNNLGLRLSGGRVRESAWRNGAIRNAARPGVMWTPRLAGGGMRLSASAQTSQASEVINTSLRCAACVREDAAARGMNCRVQSFLRQNHHKRISEKIRVRRKQRKRVSVIMRRKSNLSRHT